MKPVAWLHEVVQDDGEADQALSFSPDSFPLQGVGGFRSVKARPLFTAAPSEIMLAYENLLADQEKLRSALRTVQILRQLGGMMPGTHDVVMLAVEAADKALSHGAAENERSI